MRVQAKANFLPPLLAAMASILVTLACLMVCFAMVGVMEIARVREVHDAAGKMLAGMVRDSVTYLRTAAKDLEPDCSDKTLRALRRWTLGSSYIGEFGVFDDNRKLACTTTDGILSVPVDAGAPDAVYVLQRSGEIFNLFLNRPLEISEQGLKSSITVLGRFDAVISPFRLRELHDTGVSLIRLRLPSRVPLIMYRAPQIPDAEVAFLSTVLPVEGKLSGWNYEMGIFWVSTAVPETANILQSAIPWLAITTRYRLLILVLAAMSLVLGGLTYFATLPVIRSRLSFRAHLKHLLRPENVRCAFQPVVSLKTRKIAGCEVLMRLAYGNRVLFPDEFIPEVIAQGLTAQMDRVVVMRAAEDLEKLPLPEHFKVAVNFFPDTLQSSQARMLLNTHFAAYANRGGRVCVEVTEQQISQAIKSEVEAVKGDGYLIAVDDFGTGFSNLSSVRSIAPHYLKIDRSFVWDMEDVTVRSSLIPEIIQIARAVGAEVIAEGIENERQADRLAELGVEFGQGYYFGKPVSLAELKEWVDKEYGDEAGPRI
ncbi:EAL domain-containing protein [Propionivibrio dicarboxylicus]|uniref:cyclic-guanylate-specific phosphodiesterase n=1 Tax=Propionivibrio dicarboxylicus TaxID=83767 RepID=A0A1G8J016_9RHOO|nr:EAL domain-containing protein [Propionivibrio dicarboxylicus]SDI24317.1 EAL domain, c-di-GMP-specific phosphodiesterase class I (or its enzymatically inactive variant) [Propionivibrio dicarboxylicus]